MDLLSLENECLRYSNVPIMRAIVQTESSFNPYAIGVVNGRLERQPANKEEAVATALFLKKQGYNYSMGLSQVNQSNLSRYGLSHTTVFDPCTNIKIGSLIFNECNDRAIKHFGNNEAATRAALSCYYSGNFTRGQQREGKSPSYVERVAGILPQLKVASPKVVASSVVAASKAPQAPQKEKASWDVFRDF